MKSGSLPVFIGLCGRSGSGKGTVASFFSEFGIPSLDTDRIYRELTAPEDGSGRPAPLTAALADAFGDDIVLPDGSLDRRKLSSIVFREGGDRDRELLNRTTHGAVLDEAERRAAALFDDGFPIVIIDAPLLFESGFDKKCALVIATDAPDETLVRRIAARDGIPEEDAAARLKTQPRPETLPVDLIIDTHRSFASIRKDVGRLSEIIKEKYGK
ncbi:MAG: dephospho-CoA kinase [Clostridia bacterium]|nr:dephospho-CoA kinase [Clostridia bacterium]